MSHATLKVFCAGAVKATVADLARAFERETGHSLVFTFGTVGALLAKVSAGETVDILILNRPALSQLAEQGRLLEGAISDLGRVGVGIAVRRGTKWPDVSTPSALRESLIAAKSVAYGDPGKGDSSGIHFAKVLERLGIAAEVGKKAVLAPVGLAVAALVENGEVELGATQASVIVTHNGIALAGLLPASLQHTTTYSAAVAAGATCTEVATHFIGRLVSPAAKAKFRHAGFEQFQDLP